MLMILSLPTLALRVQWARQRKLVIDSATLYSAGVQSTLQARFNTMVTWHAMGLFFAFVNLMIHMVVALLPKHRAP